MKKQIHNYMLGLSARKRSLVGAAALMLLATGARAQFVSTVISSNLFEPNSVAIDASGNAYITDSSDDQIVKFVPGTGVVSTYAGLQGAPGSIGGNGIFARFNQPMGIVAARGGLVVVDQGNQLIRLVSTNLSAYGVVSASPLAGVVGVVGTNDGPGTSATFNYPSGIAADASGNLYVADQGNNSIRKIDAGNNVTTLVTNGYKFLKPTGVAVDNNGNVWVSDTGNQVICMISNRSAVVVAGTSGVSGFDDSITAATSLFSLPTGLLWSGANNTLFIADTGNDVLRTLVFTNFYGSNTYIVQTVAGVPGVAGSIDQPGPGEFNNPVGLALDPFNFGYYVVDRDGSGGGGVGVIGTGSLRVYQSSLPLPPPPPPVLGYVTFSSPGPGSPAVTTFNASSQATFINTAIIAIETESNTQTFITYGPTGSAISSPNPSTGSTPSTYKGDNQTTAAPSIIGPEPDVTIYAVSEGPSGELSTVVGARYQWVTANPIITGINAAALQLTDDTVGAAMYYTIDGQIPTNGAADAFGPLYSPANLSLAITSNTVLTVRAFTNNFAPSGVAILDLSYSNYVANTVNFSTNTTKGSSGGTLVVPVFVTMAQSSATLQSVQYRAEVAPTAVTTPSVSPMNDLSFSPFDYLPLPGVNGQVATFEYSQYSEGAAEGLVIFNYTNAGLNVIGNGTIGLVEIPIPTNATVGESYTLTIINPSGTSDGNQASVALSGYTNTVTITDPIYMVGDSSPAKGYNAGEFGDGALNNSDVNNSMYASVGIRVPPVFTDAYNSMDSFPDPTGDGQITMGDWNTTLLRSLGLPVGSDTNNYYRQHTTNGIITVATDWTPGGPPVGPLSDGKVVTSMSKASDGVTPPGLIWLRQAGVGAGTEINIAPGSTCSIPVYVNVSTGSSLSGLQFRAILSAEGGAPAPGAIVFSPTVGVPVPTVLPGLAPNDIACFWAVGSFPSGLKASNYLGVITFQVPATVQTGQSYALHFVGVDGLPNMETPYKLESFPGFVWVSSPALKPRQITSDEWRTTFFGSPTNSLADDYADPDGDGMLNWQEYLAGTNPTNAKSKLQFSTTSLNPNGVKGVALTWLTAPGKSYTLLSSPALGGSVWTPVNNNVGDGNNYQFIQSNSSGAARFYQLRVNQ